MTDPTKPATQEAGVMGPRESHWGAVQQDSLDCACGHPRENHADCGHGPCRSNVEIALWHDSNDMKFVGCRCRSYRVPGETVEVEP